MAQKQRVRLSQVQPQAQSQLQTQQQAAKLTTSTPKQDMAALTLAQSTAAVKTLVSTSIGCIMYLRSIFPEDHFEEVVLPSGRPVTTDESGTVVKMKGDGGIKVKMLKRRCSAECDRLLDYWEVGVQDALDKQYLKSLIIAVSLDPDDLQNIVEAYTFNFKYERVEGRKTKIPVMELTARLNGINMENGGVRLDKAPEGVLPTVREVRASVQSIIRNLVTMTTTLQELPSRRFITLKLIYNDTAPVAYQPPHFQFADAEKHRFVFGTRTMQEGPDESTFGTLETGHHSVSVHVASVADYLPLPMPHDPASEGNSVSALRELLRREEAQQKQDATERVVVWDGEETAHDGMSDIAENDEHSSSDADAEGESDEERRADRERIRRETIAREERIGMRRGIQLGVPVGVRRKDGKIEPVPMVAVDEATRRMEARAAGQTVDAEDIRDVEVFVSKMIRKEWDVDTNDDLAKNVQSLPHESMQSTVAAIGSSLAPGPAASAPETAAQRAAPAGGKERATEDADDDTNMQDVEAAATQQGVSAQQRGGSAAEQHPSPPQSQPESTPADSADPDKDPARATPAAAGDVTRCACGDNADDGLMIQCSACHVWVHAACYGIHSSKQVKESFQCYDDRFKGTPADNELVHAQLQKLAVKRRALLLMYETDRAWPETLAKLAGKIGTNMRIATNIRNELKDEGYLRNATPELDSHLFTSLRSASMTASQKKSKNRLRKAAYAQLVIVQSAAMKRQMRQRYFSPGAGIEAEIIEDGLKQGQASAQADTQVANKSKRKGATGTRRLVLVPETVNSAASRSREATLPETQSASVRQSERQAQAKGRRPAMQTSSVVQSAPGAQTSPDTTTHAAPAREASAVLGQAQDQGRQAPSHAQASQADRDVDMQEAEPAAEDAGQSADRPMSDVEQASRRSSSRVSSQGRKRSATMDLKWPGGKKKISLTSAIEIQEEASMAF